MNIRSPKNEKTWNHSQIFIDANERSTVWSTIRSPVWIVGKSNELAPHHHLSQRNNQQRITSWPVRSLSKPFLAEINPFSSTLVSMMALINAYPANKQAATRYRARMMFSPYGNWRLEVKRSATRHTAANRKYALLFQNTYKKKALLSKHSSGCLLSHCTRFRLV